MGRPGDYQNRLLLVSYSLKCGDVTRRTVSAGVMTYPLTLEEHHTNRLKLKPENALTFLG